MSWRAGGMLEKLENIKHVSGMDEKEQLEVILLIMKRTRVVSHTDTGIWKKEVKIEIDGQLPETLFVTI